MAAAVVNDHRLAVFDAVGVPRAVCHSRVVEQDAGARVGVDVGKDGFDRLVLPAIWPRDLLPGNHGGLLFCSLPRVGQWLPIEQRERDGDDDE